MRETLERCCLRRGLENLLTQWDAPRNLTLPGETDLATRFPDLAAQWHPTLYETLRPDMVTPGSHRKVWWICPLGHVWKAVIYSRAGGKHCGCPICSARERQRRRRQALAMPPRTKEAMQIL